MSRRGQPQHAVHPRATLGPHRNSIRRYRLRANLTQQDLAERLGVVRWQTVSEWERGWRLPRLRNLLRMAKELGTLVESLYWDFYAPRAPRARDDDDHAFAEKTAWEPRSSTVPAGGNPVTRAVEILRRRYGRVTKRQRAFERMQLYAAVARELRQARTRAGLTQQQLGRFIGRSAAMVARAENEDDHHGHTLHLLLRTSVALNRRLEFRLVPREGRRLPGTKPKH